VQRLDVAEVGSEFGLSLRFSELADSRGAIYNKSTITNEIVISIFNAVQCAFLDLLLCKYPW
jgi:hypothetical protein